MHPLVGGGQQQHADVCMVYRDIYDLAINESATRDASDLVPCAEFVFSVDVRSVITTYGLVCGRKFLSAFAQCFHIVGLLIGGVLAFHFLRMYV